LAWGRGLIGATVPLVAIAGGLLTEYEMGATDGGIRLLEGTTMGVILTVLIVALAGQLRRRAIPEPGGRARLER
jgi:hypothetical protein